MANVIQDISEWAKDACDLLISQCLHTAQTPMRCACERWQLVLRCCYMLQLGKTKSIYEVVSQMPTFRISWSKLAVAIRKWQHCQDKAEFANTMPPEHQLGRYGTGYLTNKLQFDLVAWTRAREKPNTPSANQRSSLRCRYVGCKWLQTCCS